ncbi:MAG: hypothetical protein DRM99_00455 [Thermoplasmata archaeon]|nr:MAG: hypothetical protein DRM99_00455 [Thermoplasmata archaeon]
MVKKKKYNRNRLVSLIIVNWNGEDVLAECLDSVFSQDYKPIKVIVVDNGSQDNSLKIIKRYKKIKLIKNFENLGFAEGNNIGIRAAKGDYIFLLNNDTVLKKNCITELINAIEATSEVAFVGPRINYYKTDKIWSLGVRVEYLSYRHKLMTNELDKVTQVPYIVGCAMMCRADVIKSYPLMDPGYFSYYEESDWQARIKKNGYKILVAPGAVVWHKIAQSTGGADSAFSIYYLSRNRGYFIKKNLNLTQKFTAYPLYLAEIKIRFWLYILKGKPKLSKYTLIGFLDFLKGKRGKVDYRF